jgi:hypothetical protein
MAYLGNAPARSFISFEKQVFTIVNSQTAYTLSHSVNNENDIRLVINNIVQEPGSGKAYTASGTTLTLSAALTNGTDEMYCVFLGRATATNAPGAGSVNTAVIAADAITEAKIADDAVESEHLNNNVISGQTELAAEPADTDEFLVSDAGTIKRIDYSYIKGSTSTPAFHVGQATGQSISNDTFTKITLDHTELLDTDNAFSSSRFTPQTAGTYLIYGMVRLHGTDDFDNFNVSIYKNSDRVLDMQGSHFHYETKNVFGMVTLNGSSDYVELFCRQTSGGSMNTRPGDISGAQTFFGGFKIT